MEKQCYTCKKVKPISDYPKDKQNKGGYKGRCRTCIYDYTKSYWVGRGYKSEYHRIKAKREKVKLEYGFGGGLYWRYGLKVLVPLFDKYDGRCAECKSSDNLTVHHLDGKGRHYWEKTRQRMNNSLENLMLLCRRCHGSIDGKKQRKQPTK